jgi:hypothetical protein
VCAGTPCARARYTGGGGAQPPSKRGSLAELGEGPAVAFRCFALHSLRVAPKPCVRGQALHGRQPASAQPLQKPHRHHAICCTAASRGDMHRLSRPLQRVQSVGGWRALLAAADDAACSRACGQGDARLAAADARFGVRRGARAHSGAPLAAEAGVVCACVLERLPIVVPPQPAWEVEFQARGCVGCVRLCGMESLRPRCCAHEPPLAGLAV